MRLVDNRYGKSKVRLVHVERAGARHTVRDFTVDIQLAGDYARAYSDGDNRQVLPTDTMKNTVYALARESAPGEPESFALRLGRHFLRHNPEAASARVAVRERPWRRLEAAGGPHPHAFERDAGGERLADAWCRRDGESVESGLDGLVVLKSTGSAFSGFRRDGWTTLREARDRIFATEVRATWSCGGGEIDWQASFAGVRDALRAAFAAHDESESVQHTLWAMGEAVFAERPEVARIHLALPNLHHLLVDLEPFGMDNPLQVFVSTSEPHGLIEATLERG
jgi:urate oxidase